MKPKNTISPLGWEPIKLLFVFHLWSLDLVDSASSLLVLSWCWDCWGSDWDGSPRFSFRFGQWFLHPLERQLDVGDNVRPRMDPSILRNRQVSGIRTTQVRDFDGDSPPCSESQYHRRQQSHAAICARAVIDIPLDANTDPTRSIRWLLRSISLNKTNTQKCWQVLRF